MKENSGSFFVVLRGAIGHSTPNLMWHLQRYIKLPRFDGDLTRTLQQGLILTPRHKIDHGILHQRRANRLVCL
jgi:hypothetical protein